MCLILFAWKTDPKFDLVLAANRDEFYDRPTQSAHQWKGSEIIAGKDLTAGGTWIGLTKTGRFAALTNFRDLQNLDPNAPSRGQLATDFLTSNHTPKDYLQSLKSEKKNYNGFNLLVGDRNALWYYNNINYEISEIQSGIYGLSNGLLNEPWPKVDIGKNDLNNELNNGTKVDALFSLLTNEQIAPDEILPSTGVPLDWERSLSPLFIKMDNYGTRCSTVITRNQHTISFHEKTYHQTDQHVDDFAIQFDISH